MNPEELVRVLLQARQQGLLKPSAEENICFSKYLNTANYLLFLLEQAGRAGLSTSQVSSKLDFRQNTSRCYLRELENIGLIAQQKNIPKESIWFYLPTKQPTNF